MIMPKTDRIESHIGIPKPNKASNIALEKIDGMHGSQMKEKTLRATPIVSRCLMLHG